MRTSRLVGRAASSWLHVTCNVGNAHKPHNNDDHYMMSHGQMMSGANERIIILVMIIITRAHGLRFVPRRLPEVEPSPAARPEWPRRRFGRVVPFVPQGRSLT